MDPGHWLAGAAARHPDRTAVEAPGGALAYRDLLARAHGAAASLHARGVRRGDPVGLLLEPGLPFVVALHGCLLLGAPAVPVDPRLSGRERSAVLRATGARVEQPLEEGARGFALPAPAPPGATALIIHTSGTTGTPRPVELSYANVRANAAGVAAALELGDDERWLCPLPLSHVGGLMAVLRSALLAGAVVLQPPPFDARATAEQLRDGAVSVASLVPAQLQRLLDAGASPGPRLRRVLLGGGPMPRALLASAAAAGFPVCPSYGLTQACSTVCVAAPGDLETAGRPLPGVHLDIAPDGEIVVGGPTVSGGGRVHTGDLGRLDDAGRLIVTGRKGDLIITGGENVAPAEIEAVLAEHPGVAESAVLGRPDPLWGEAVVALVVARPGVAPTPDELRAHCRGRLARHKVPKAFELVASLPRTESGKVRRAQLR